VKPHLNILYLCKTINSRHGGRTHAREFFAALHHIDGVDNVDSYYELEDDSNKQGLSKQKRSKLWWLPTRVQTFLRMVLIQHKRTNDISRRLASKKYDLLLVRHETGRIDFAELKHRHPNVKIAIELNAILSNEQFKSVLVRNITKLFEFKQFRQVDKIFPVSSTLRQSLLDAGIYMEKIVVNPNGVDVARFDSGLLSQRAALRRQYGIPEDKFVIGYVGGMEQFRRLPEFVRSYSLLANGALGDKLFLFMVGDGQDFSAVETELGQVCPEGSYRQLGWQNHADVPNIMATFDLAVMPYTLDYCSPLKLFEYMAMGLPTIGPDTPSVRELFRDGEHLWLNPQNMDTPNYLIELIGRLVDNLEQRANIAEQGCHWVKENYTWCANAKRVVKQL